MLRFESSTDRLTPNEGHRDPGSEAMNRVDVAGKEQWQWNREQKHDHQADGDPNGEPERFLKLGIVCQAGE